MKDAVRHLDRRFATIKRLRETPRPPKGWVRAIRNALGMTTAQLGQRLGVSQPRVVEIEQAEVSGSITLHTLQRAAEALGCRFVYALIPDRPLEETVRQRAGQLAREKLTAVEQTMRLEDQSVKNKTASTELLRQFIDVLLKHPARLWDEK
jgi:predicted DNA-binding mobile mystery protein A